MSTLGGHRTRSVPLTTMMGVTTVISGTLALLPDHGSRAYGILSTLTTIFAAVTALLLAVRVMERRLVSRQQAAAVAERQSYTERIAELISRHDTELRDTLAAAERRYEALLTAEVDRHRHEEWRLHGVIQQVLADQGAGQERAREQGRAEVTQIMHAREASLIEQHEVRLREAAQAEYERGLTDGFPVGYEARSAESRGVQGA